ncbi:MAG: beta-ketoacyl-ACP synthase II [Planctomycetota bacterium]
MKRVVVTGLGCVSPFGRGVALFWQGLLEGRSAAGTITRFDASTFEARIACEVPAFSSEDALDKREERRMDPYSRFAMVAAHDAMKDSGLMDKAVPERVGCILGVGIGGLEELETQIERFLKDGHSKVSPFYIPKLMPNAASGNISIGFGLLGPSYSVSSACASASHAMGDAWRLVALGEADAVVTGGAEATIRPSAIAGFQNMKALSRRNDDPKAASRPFDVARDGFVMGEGSGILIFEELEHAKKRGAKIYAEVLGAGATSDAVNISAPSPDGSGPSRAMLQTLAPWKVDPSRVGYINAHGTSTPLGDISEVKSVKRAFGEHAKKICISSTKSMIGHLLGASGAVELLATVMTVHEGKVHPTINVVTQDPECDLDVVPNKAREKKIDVALSNSFGFGGHNACMAVARFA